MKKIACTILFTALPLYYVNAAEVSTSADFRDALTSGNSIVLKNDIVLSDTENGVSWSEPASGHGNNITITN